MIINVFPLFSLQSNESLLVLLRYQYKSMLFVEEELCIVNVFKYYKHIFSLFLLGQDLVCWVSPDSLSWAITISHKKQLTWLSHRSKNFVAFSKKLEGFAALYNVPGNERWASTYGPDQGPTHFTHLIVFGSFQWRQNKVVHVATVPGKGSAEDFSVTKVSVGIGPFRQPTRHL